MSAFARRTDSSSEGMRSSASITWMSASLQRTSFWLRHRRRLRDHLHPQDCLVRRRGHGLRPRHFANSGRRRCSGPSHSHSERTSLRLSTYLRYTRKYCVDVYRHGSKKWDGWQLHYGDMCAVVEVFCSAPPFSLCCCPRPILRLHSLLTVMASPPTYGSQCTPSLARASCIGVLSESLHCFMRIRFDCHLAVRLEICGLKFIRDRCDLPTEQHMHAQCESCTRQLCWGHICSAAQFHAHSF